MRLGEHTMQCPDCRSTHIRKNGHRKGKQNHICADCHRQFIDDYRPYQGYSDEVRRECLKMYVFCLGISWHRTRSLRVHHTTVISWVKAVGELLPDAYSPDQIPTVGELDELETFVRSKKLKSGSGRR